MPSDNSEKKEQDMDAGKGRTSTLSSPARLLAILALSVFSAELGVMVALYFLKDTLHPFAIILIDAPLLVLTLWDRF